MIAKAVQPICMLSINKVDKTYRSILRTRYSSRSHLSSLMILPHFRSISIESWAAIINYEYKSCILTDYHKKFSDTISKKSLQDRAGATKLPWTAVRN